MANRRAARDYVMLGLEFVFISGLLAVAVLAIPFIAWKWLTEPREWRKPRDVGNGAYEHP